MNYKPIYFVGIYRNCRLPSLFITPPPPTPPPPCPSCINTEGEGTGITLSVCPSVVLSVCLIVSAQYLLHRSIPPPFFFKTKLGMVVHEAMCHAQQMVHYLQCQGHGKD